MRALKLCVVLGLLLAVTGMAQALTLVYEEGPNTGLPFIVPPGGTLPNTELTIKLGDYTTGVQYVPHSVAGGACLPFPHDGGLYAAGVVAADLLEAGAIALPINRQISGSAGGDPGDLVPGPSAPGAFGNGLEDAWGIARVTRIEDPIGHAIWTPVAKGHDLAVILWGLQDFFVGPSLDSTKDLINAGGLHVDMYSIPLNVWGWPGNAPLAGAAGRLPGNVYPSINDAGQVLELSMRSLPGFINPPGVNGGLAAEFESDIDLNELTGNGQSFVEITGGASAGLFDFDGFPMPGPAAGILGPLGYDITADMRLQFDSNPTNVADWTVESDDPVQGHGFAIPEPLTIAGVFAGICGLGGYLRKRRIA